MSGSLAHGRYRSLAGALLAALTGAMVWPGPAPSQTVEEVFRDTVEVLEIQVPVNVVGKNGLPVRGLTAEDFQIFDGNDRQEITAFQMIDLEVIEPGTLRREIELAVPAAARRHFLLLFDLSFATPISVLKARTAARDFVLESLHPTDLAAVAIHEAEWGPRLVITFTPDREQLARAIDTLGASRWRLASNSGDPLRFMVPEMPPGGSPGISDPLPLPPGALLGGNDQLALSYLTVMGKVMDKSEKSYNRGRVFSWAASMGKLAKILDSVKGRKHVVYFSEGFDGTLLFGRKPDPNDPKYQQDIFNIERGNIAFVDSNDLYGSTPLQNAMVDMVSEFRRADTVIQAVDISGLGTDSEAAGRVKSTTQDALFYVANETGGELFEDANNFGEELEQVLRHTSVTYLLTFRPSKIAADGKFRRLRVKADLPGGARLYHRQGYYAPRPYEDLDPLEKQLLASDAIASAEEVRDVRIDVLAAPFRASDLEAYVPVIIEIDGDTLLRGQKGDQLSAEIYTYVSDDQGRMLDFFTQLVSLDVSRGREGFMRGGVKYYGQLFLEPGEYLIRVLVRNSSTGRSGVETVAVSVPSYEAQPAVLLPPLFLERQKRWVLVREEREGLQQRSIVYPFTVNGEPFIPSAKPLLGRREEIEVCLVGYNLAPGELEVKARVLGQDDQPIEGGTFDLVERTITGISGLDKLLVRFRPDGLVGGDYRVQFAVSQPEGDSILSSPVPITVLN